MKWDDLLLLPFLGFIQWPWAALIPAGVLGFLYTLRQRRTLLIAVVLWVLYAAYEFLMKTRVLCSGECNIRIDLLVIVPFLYILSLVGIVNFFLRKVPDGAA